MNKQQRTARFKLRLKHQHLNDKQFAENILFRGACAWVNYKRIHKKEYEKIVGNSKLTGYRASKRNSLSIEDKTECCILRLKYPLLSDTEFSVMKLRKGFAYWACFKYRNKELWKRIQHESEQKRLARI